MDKRPDYAVHLYELIPGDHVLPGRKLEEIVPLANLVQASDIQE